jgi:hypothetical protein
MQPCAALTRRVDNKEDLPRKSTERCWILTVQKQRMEKWRASASQMHMSVRGLAIRLLLGTMG